MIFVNTDLETVVSRDAKRDRTLGAKNINSNGAGHSPKKHWTVPKPVSTKHVYC